MGNARGINDRSPTFAEAAKTAVIGLMRHFNSKPSRAGTKT
jgi:hypothetical protein